MEARRSNSRAFTLLELLAAMTITLLLVTILAQVVSSVTTAWNRGNGDSERRQNARALTDFIARELRAAIIPLNATSNSTLSNLQFILNPDKVGSSNRNSSALFWQAPVATDSSASDLAEIGYFVRWVPGNVPQARLCRFFVNPSDAKNYLIYSGSNSTQWVSDTILSSVAPADSQSGYVGLFAENVAGFWARCLNADGSVAAKATEQYDSRNTHALPYCVEISILLLDSHSASIMNSSLQSQLIKLVNSAVNADDCASKILTNAQTTPGMNVIAQGARAHTVRVYLENAR